MRKLFSSKKSKRSNKKTRKLIPICIAAVCAFFVVFGVIIILSGYFKDAAARMEYDKIREIFMNPSPAPNIQETPPDTSEDIDDIDEESEPYEYEEFDFGDSIHSIMEELAAINQDFIGWISIENLVEYPVVRGTNNDKYIYTTFSGGRNNAGAIFMDYRNKNNFDDTVAILFGHRTRDRTMFSSLSNYLSRTFLEENSIITIYTRDGRELIYKVFAAKLTDAWDAAYTTSFTNPARASSSFPNVPSDASQFLLLSTCTANDNRDERIIVFAALVQ